MGVSRGAFNALSAVGRLLAALMQKSRFNTQNNSSDNILLLYTVMKRYEEEKPGKIRLENDDYKVIWLSLFDWLLHWTTKVDSLTDFPKFEIDSFKAHVKAFVDHQD